MIIKTTKRNDTKITKKKKKKQNKKKQFAIAILQSHVTYSMNT